MELCRSPLGIQCETLTITVKNKRNILALINNMPNLRSLHVCSLDYYWPTNGSVSFAIEEIVQWLRQQLPSTCAVTEDYSSDILVWIR
ncbi:hypothetical protein I4U23_005824 [Adineta vaga]|nr:hypothetical protein I4U23_005824 [Adineta vaga]